MTLGLRSRALAHWTACDQPNSRLNPTSMLVSLNFGQSSQTSLAEPLRRCAGWDEFSKLPCHSAAFFPVINKLEQRRIASRSSSLLRAEKTLRLCQGRSLRETFLAFPVNLPAVWTRGECVCLDPDNVAHAERLFAIVRDLFPQCGKGTPRNYVYKLGGSDERRKLRRGSP